MTKHSRPASRHAELGDFKTIAEAARSRGGTRRKKKPRPAAEPPELPQVSNAAT